MELTALSIHPSLIYRVGQEGDRKYGKEREDERGRKRRREKIGGNRKESKEEEGIRGTH